jgi:hypothetical protein
MFVRATEYTIQSTKLFLQSSELGLPHPPLHTQASVFPPPPLWLRGGTLACERGGGGGGPGGSQLGRGDRHCRTLGTDI